MAPNCSHSPALCRAVGFRSCVSLPPGLWWGRGRSGLRLSLPCVLAPDSEGPAPVPPAQPRLTGGISCPVRSSAGHRPSHLPWGSVWPHLRAWPALCWCRCHKGDTRMGWLRGLEDAAGASFPFPAPQRGHFTIYTKELAGLAPDPSAELTGRRRL